MDNYAFIMNKLEMYCRQLRELQHQDKERKIFFRTAAEFDEHRTEGQNFAAICGAVRSVLIDRDADNPVMRMMVPVMMLKYAELNEIKQREQAKDDTLNILKKFAARLRFETEENPDTEIDFNHFRFEEPPYEIHDYVGWAMLIEMDIVNDELICYEEKDWIDC